ncbi:hypothetical protein MSHRCOH1_06450 [Candidatus Ornithobacterium hominis]|uniref:hypothetical protein n=1 Tax=Candidatus Ornithobacterium hominis TaxID=2497989 RepID=UPI0024BD56CB|nr:hypothetical protein [Candidatus Ornithobacterium hominis]CAI9429834.1 hypothetical protein MSHRCOH1_06450 [Candidatus Ornithobacterium hominis]
MNAAVQNKWNELEGEVHELLISYEKQKAQLAKLKEENERLEESIYQQQVRIQELQNINKQLKVAGALGGNPKHRRLMKFKLNQLIKEVDYCIAEVSKANL